MIKVNVKVGNKSWHNKIKNPEKIDRNYDKIDNDHFNYGIFCGYFSVKYNGNDY